MKKKNIPNTYVKRLFIALGCAFLLVFYSLAGFSKTVGVKQGSTPEELFEQLPYIILISILLAVFYPFKER